ncbi:Na/H antiporter [Lojkania enalia]|uniref:Na/H antiporter n=1 Tax=Lojkania enalia TaxID=147567 RepID=A0A9P4KIX8_9PLEO|nr:Na/H antiporter [Didymosphaeria enalia]
MNSPVLNFDLVCCALGGFITLFGLVSYLFKERWYLTEPVVALWTGLLLSPYGLNLIRPLEYSGSNEGVAMTTLCFTRLVLGIQLVIAGIQLPSKFLTREWRSLLLLLGPGMITMWICTSLLVWTLIPSLNMFESLVVGACVTPTDPVLSNSIVKGEFADRYLSRSLQHLIVAESGANDGLGYMFLFFPLYMIKFAKESDNSEGIQDAITAWLSNTFFYTIILSILVGAAVGLMAKGGLRWAKKKDLVDKESFSLFAIGLALSIIGIVGAVDSDDVLACFIAGCAFAWDDWFCRHIEGDSLHSTIDMLLNMAVFMWVGAVCPWDAIISSGIVPINRLFILGILVLLLRRLPFVLAVHRKMDHIQGFSQASLVGFFGPIGISAIFYLHVCLEFLHDIVGVQSEREECKRLADATLVVVWFLVISSIVVHGLSIPLGNLAIHAWSPFYSLERSDSGESCHFKIPTFQNRRRNERTPLLADTHRRTNSWYAN